MQWKAGSRVFCAWVLLVCFSVFVSADTTKLLSKVAVLIYTSFDSAHPYLCVLILLHVLPFSSLVVENEIC